MGTGNDLLRLAASIGDSQQQPASFQPAQLLQVRQTLAQRQATQVAAQQAEIQKRIEAEATTRVVELVEIENLREAETKKRPRHERNETR